MSAVLEKLPEVDMKSDRVTIDLPVTTEMQRLARPAGALIVAQAYEVDCAEMAQSLANERITWAQRIDAIEALEEDFMSPVKQAVKDMKAKVVRWFGPTKADYVAARDLAGQKLLAWDQQEKARMAREQAERDALARRLRQEAEAKAAAELAKAEEAAREARQRAAAAEAERARQAAEAERLRSEGDAKAAAEAERKAKAAAAEAAKQSEREVAASQNGAAKAASIHLEAAAAASSHAPVLEAVKIAGQSTKENWVAVLQEGFSDESAKLQIVLAIAGVYMNDDGKITFDPARMRDDLLALLTVDTAAKGPLNKLAAAQKAHMRVPGYRAENQPTLAGKRK